MRLQRTSSVELLFILEQVKTVPNGRLFTIELRMPLKRKKRVELLFRSKEKLNVKLDVSAAQKKYPLYRLAMIPLELLDRKPYEMHPSWLSFAVKLTAFFGYFLLLLTKSDWLSGHPRRP